MHSISGFFFVSMCMHVQMRASMTERERERRGRGDPSGSGFLKTALYFTKSFVSIDLYKNKKSRKHKEVKQIIQVF